MNDPAFLLLFFLLLGASFWNFFAATMMPHRVPSTVRGCVLWAGIEGIIVSGSVLVAQSTIEPFNGVVAVFNAFPYGFGWFMVSMLSKNQYRRLSAKELSEKSERQFEEKHKG